ncbi:MAG: hypothetical protein K9K30_16175 [Burkholderiaceae bacterium]|nr:hypothetical protein [Burkholderiaceae bacterium]
MKRHFHQNVPLLLPLLAAAFLSSCVESGYPGDYTVTASGYGTYNVLPTNYVGSAYYYNGRYYAGGRYQTGRYNYQGRSYDNRYYYNGQYFYGGRYQQHGTSTPRQDSRRGQDRPGYRESPGPPPKYNHSGAQAPAGHERTNPYRTSLNPYR